jgi:hypothetical protein
MAVNFGARGIGAIGAATANFLALYNTTLRRPEDSERNRHENSERNRHQLFGAFQVPAQAKAWIDRSGKIVFGGLPGQTA